MRERDLTAGEVAARFPLTAASISHHLKVLEEAGLVAMERDGRHIVYSLDSAALQEFVEELMACLGVGGRR